MLFVDMERGKKRTEKSVPDALAKKKPVISVYVIVLTILFLYFQQMSCLCKLYETSCGEDFPFQPMQFRTLGESEETSSLSIVNTKLLKEVIWCNRVVKMTSHLLCTH